MKIAQVVSTYPPYHGGMGNVAQQYAKNLTRRGHLVTVFTPDYGQASSQSDSNNSDVGVTRVKPHLSLGNAAWLPALPNVLQDFDIVHFHYPFIGGESVLKISGRLIITYHMDLLGRGWKKYFFNGYQRKYLPKFFERAAKVIFTSSDYLNHSRAAQFKNRFGDKFAILPLGADEAFGPLVSRQDNFWRERGITAEKIIMFVGGLDKAHYFKGLGRLIEALASLKDEQLALVVIGDGDLREDYLVKARRQDLKKVFFLGRVSRPDLIKYYQQCDFVVLPSVDSSEAFGLVILEALACGKPVIASNLPGVRTLIDSGVDGLLCRPGDANDLADQIKRMLKLDLDQMGRRAGRKVNEYYRWPKIIDQIEKLYL